MCAAAAAVAASAFIRDKYDCKLKCNSKRAWLLINKCLSTSQTLNHQLDTSNLDTRRQYLNAMRLQSGIFYVSPSVPLAINLPTDTHFPFSKRVSLSFSLFSLAMALVKHSIQRIDAVGVIDSSEVLPTPKTVT